MQLLEDAQAPARKRNGLIISAVVHAVVLAFCYFFVRWTPPDPPLPDYGVELNFGIDAEGFGNLQSLAPANESTETNASPGPPEPTPPQPDQQPSTPASTEADPEEVASENVQETESPVEVPKKQAPARVEPKSPVKEVKPAPSEPKRDIPPPPSYTPNTKPGGGGTGTGSGTAGNNNGDRPGKVGDQGDRRGTLEGKALYGNPGNGTGANLDLAGWNWDSRPDKVDPFDEEGKIVFEIKVDDEGNLVNVRPVEKTVSPKVVQFYQKQVEELTFSKTRDNASPAPISSGRITIIIRSR